MRPCFYLFHRPQRIAQAVQAVASRGLMFSILLAALSYQSFAESGPIAAVQNALIREQFLSGEPSGVFDASTRGALQRFQIQRSLPPTGEIDTATILALQNTARTGAVTIMSQPPGKNSPAIAESDREFLNRLERGNTEPPAETEVAPVVMLGPVAQSETPSQKAIVKPPNQGSSVNQKKELPKTKPRFVTKREAGPTFQQDDSIGRIKAAEKSESVTSSRRTRAVDGTGRTKAGYAENNPDILAPHGARVIRSTTTTTGPDGRTYVYERTTTTFDGTPAPVRRATAVESRPKDNGFVHRLFRED